MNRKNTVFRAAQILGKKASNRIRKNGKEGIVTENSWVPRQPFWLLRDGQIDPTFHCSTITWMFTTPMTQSYGRYLILTKVEENQKTRIVLQYVTIQPAENCTHEKMELKISEKKIPIAARR